MSDYHEPTKDLSSRTRDYTRALKILIEEVEAIDWYQQRVDASSDEHLIKIMEHNRDEEIEHACMMLEWLRRNMPGWDEEMRTYLFTEGDVSELEEEEECEDEDDNSSSHKDDGSIGLTKKNLQ